MSETGRQGNEIRLRRVDHHPLREGSRVGETGLALVRAHGGGAGPAYGTGTAGQDEGRRDIAPHPTAIDAAAHGLDDPGELVTGHMREHPDIRVVPAPAVPIAAAQAGGEHPHDGRPRWGTWLGQLRNRQRAPELGIGHGAHNPTVATPHTLGGIIAAFVVPRQEFP